jgi:hypothetical protein
MQAWCDVLFFRVLLSCVLWSHDKQYLAYGPGQTFQDRASEVLRHVFSLCVHARYLEQDFCFAVRMVWSV